jgi:hypothetical protein
MASTRRGFIRALSGVVSYGREFRHAVTAGVAAAFSWACATGLRVVSGHWKYRLVTDAGDIVLGIPDRLPKVFSSVTRSNCYLELPAAVLLRLQGAVLPQCDPKLPPDRIFLKDQELNIVGKVTVSFGLLSWDGDLTLRFSIQSLFASASHEAPLEVVLHGPARVLLTAGGVYPVLATELPRFDLFALTEKKHRHVLGRKLAFEADGISVETVAALIPPSDDPVPFDFFRLKEEREPIVLVISLVKVSRLVWRPGRLRFISPEVKAKIVRGVESAEITGLFAVKEEDGRHRAMGSRESVVPGAPEDADGLRMSLVTTMELTTGGTALSGVRWPLVPGNIQRSDQPASPGFAVLNPEAIPETVVSVRTAEQGPELSLLTQEYKNLRMSWTGAPGGFDAPLAPPIAKHELRWDSRNTLTLSRMPDKCDANPGTPVTVQLGDVIVRCRSIRQLLLVWNSGGPLDIATGKFCVTAFAWAGRLGDTSNRYRDGWVALAPLSAFSTDGGRGDFVDLGGERELGWNYERCRNEPTTSRKCPSTKFDLEKVVSSPAELRSLSEDSFRASINATFPLRAAGPDGKPRDGVDTLFLPPFSLREHPDTAEWVIANDPLFDAQYMWEPSSIVSIPAEPDQQGLVQQIFSSIGDGCRRGALEFFNAGLRFTGRVLPLWKACWGPRGILAAGASAPYWAVEVDDVHETEALDLVPKGSAQRCVILDGIHPKAGFEQTRASLLAALRSPRVPVALSALGGSIDFDWQLERPKAGLRSLGLHSYLARYQRNTAVLQCVILPWGLLVEITTSLHRQNDGTIGFEEKWAFLESEKAYGAGGDLRIRNLRPLNAADRANDGPFRFSADLELRKATAWAVARSVQLQGWETNAVAETVSFEGREGFADPVTLFNDTVLIVRRVEWNATVVGNAQPPTPNPCPASRCYKNSQITVTATGDLPHAPVSAVVDNKTTTCSSLCVCDKDTGTLGSFLDQTVFETQAMSLGPGLLRVPNPFTNSFQKEARTLQNNHVIITYHLEQDVDLWQLGILQILNVEPPNPQPEVKGKMLVTIEYDSGDTSGIPLTKASLTFPDLTSIAKPICNIDHYQFRIAAQPKSFEWRWNNKSNADNLTRLVTDIGVPGILNLKNTEFTQAGDGGLVPKLGGLEFCSGLLNLLLDKILLAVQEKLGLGGGDTKFEIHFFKDALFFKLPSIDIPAVPLGGGRLRHLGIDLRMELKLDFSALGKSSGAFFAIFFGKFHGPRFGGIDWYSESIDGLGHVFLRLLEPAELSFTPYVVRFGGMLGVRLTAGKGNTTAVDLPNPDKLTMQAFVCIAIEGGIGVSFDYGIARGGVSVALALRYCPTVTVRLNGTQLCLTKVGIGIVVDGDVEVARVVTIHVHAEIVGTLQLACGKPNEMLCNVVFSGYASVDLWLVTVDYPFSVSLDNVLGFHCCNDKSCDVAGTLGFCPPEELVASVRGVLDEFYSMVGIAA